MQLCANVHCAGNPIVYRSNNRNHSVNACRCVPHLIRFFSSRQICYVGSHKWSTRWNCLTSDDVLGAERAALNMHRNAFYLIHTCGTHKALINARSSALDPYTTRSLTQSVPPPSLTHLHRWKQVSNESVITRALLRLERTMNLFGGREGGRGGRDRHVILLRIRELSLVRW